MDILKLKNINKKLHLNFAEEKIPTRNGYGDALVELGRTNKNVMVLCADLTDSTRVKKFQEKVLLRTYKGKCKFYIFFFSIMY